MKLSKLICFEDLITLKLLQEKAKPDEKTKTKPKKEVCIFHFSSRLLPFLAKFNLG